MEDKRKSGLWTTAKLIAVSDTHLKWWLTEGPGAEAQRTFPLHFCLGPSGQCTKTKRRPEYEFHTDYFRSLTADEIANLKIPWMKSAEAKSDMEAEVAKLTGTPSGAAAQKKGNPRASGKDAALDWSPSDDQDGQGDGDSILKGDDVRKKLQALKEDLKGDGKVKKKDGKEKDKGMKSKKERDRRGRSRSRGRQKKRDLASASSQDKYARGKWFGKVTQVSSSSTSSSSDKKGAEAQDKGKSKKKDKKAKGSKKKKRRKDKAADHGPFSAGPLQRYDGKASGSESLSSDEKEESSVFRAQVSQKSRQLQLQEYSLKYPRQLTARLLRKMQHFLAREDTPMQQIEGLNMTPAVATSYLLTVTMVQYKERLNMRTLRELKSLSKALDLIVQGSSERAADVIAHRVKSIEVSLADQIGTGPSTSSSFLRRVRFC